MSASDARPVPRKNTAYRTTFPIFNISGDPVTSGVGLESKISKDQGIMVACTGEAVYITGSAGMYYLDITSTEMNADTVAIEISSTGLNVKTTSLVLYPEEEGDYRVNKAGYTISGTIKTLDTLDTEQDALHDITHSSLVTLALSVNGIDTKLVNHDSHLLVVSGNLNNTSGTLATVHSNLLSHDSHLLTTSGNLNTISTNLINTSGTLATLVNTSVPYYAKIDLTIDSSNSRDEYTVQWYSGTSPTTTGVTNPTLEVIKRDGTTLISSTGMTQIGSTHVFSYNESVSARRVTAGDAVIITVQGSIAGSTRTWRNLLSRDS